MCERKQKNRGVDFSIDVGKDGDGLPAFIYRGDCSDWVKPSVNSEQQSNSRLATGRPTGGIGRGAGEGHVLAKQLEYDVGCSGSKWD
jgi:hypothetical protein